MKPRINDVLEDNAFLLTYHLIIDRVLTALQDEWYEGEHLYLDDNRQILSCTTFLKLVEREVNNHVTNPNENAYLVNKFQMLVLRSITKQLDLEVIINNDTDKELATKMYIKNREQRRLNREQWEIVKQELKI